MVIKQPSRRSSGEGKSDDISTWSGIGMGHIGSHGRGTSSVSSVDSMGIIEVSIHRYGLAWSGDLHGELDIFCAMGTGPRSLLSVVVDVAESRLIVGEGISVGIRCGRSIDDVRCVAIQGVGGRIEGVEEVVVLTRLFSSEGWSAEGRWESGQFSVSVEVLEEVGSHTRYIARIKASRGKARQGTVAVEGSEEAVSYCRDVACVETSRWEARQEASIVEVLEETISHRSDVARIKASRGKARQGTVAVEGGEEVCSYRRDITYIKASLREARQGTIVVKSDEEVFSCRGDMTRIKTSFG